MRQFMIGPFDNVDVLNTFWSKLREHDEPTFRSTAYRSSSVRPYRYMLYDGEEWLYSTRRYPNNVITPHVAIAMLVGNIQHSNPFNRIVGGI